MMDYVEHGNMTPDPRQEWPNDEPVGAFDIEPTPHGVEGYPGVTARIIFVCPNNQRCSVFLAPQPIPRQAEGKCHIWGWDGNREKPTITPSINCIATKDGKPTGGCGWHGFIQNGVMR